MKPKKRAIVRKEAPATTEELPAVTGAFKWFGEIAHNERFHIVIDLLKRTKRFKTGDLQPLPHQQHFSSGYDAGFNDCIDKLYEIAANPPSTNEEVEAFTELTDRKEIYTT